MGWRFGEGAGADGGWRYVEQAADLGVGHGQLARPQHGPRQVVSRDQAVAAADGPSAARLAATGRVAAPLAGPPSAEHILNIINIILT